MKKIYKFLFSLAIAILINTFPLSAQVPSQSTDVMLQGFGWDTYSVSNWVALTGMASEMEGKFDLIWLPASGNDLTTNSMGYLPVFYFDQNSSFGTRAELESLIQTLNSKGIKAIADVVINHRNGETNWVDFPTENYNSVSYEWGLEAICAGDEVKDQSLSYDHMPQGDADTGENYGAARDIDHTNANVQNTIKAYLDFLKNDIGYSGWRYDLVKGYDGSYNEIYNNSANAYFSVGEYWDGNYDLVTGWINSTNFTSTAFDFPQKYALNNAFNDGYNLTELVWARNGTLNQPAGLVHHNDYKKYAVTFVDNHDTGRSENPSRFTGNVLAAYAFILSGPGFPCVWMNHWNDDAYKTQINELIAARKSVEIHNESEVVVNHSASDLYVATATGLSGSLIVKIGTGSYSAPSDYVLQTSGTDYAVWTRKASSSTQSITVRFNPENTGWSNVNVYGWDSSDALNIWPGDVATDEGNGWFAYTFPEVSGNLNVVFNNGSEQTTDVYHITSDACFGALATTNGDGKYPHTELNCTDGSSKAPISIGFENTDNWSSVYMYTWDAYGSTLNGAWPGESVSASADGWFRYDFDASLDHVNVLFHNNNGAQTGNIENVTASGCYSFTGHMATPALVSCPGVVTSFADISGETDSYSVSPNPATNSIVLNTSGNVSKALIVSINGAVIEIIDHPEVGKEIDVTMLQPGAYFIIIENDKGKQSVGKFIKR